MNIRLKSIISAVFKVFRKIKPYFGFAFIIGVLCLYGFLIFRIGTLASHEPAEAAVTEQLNTLKRLKIDQTTIDKINQLEDQNVSVQSLFKSARDNPFEDN